MRNSELYGDVDLTGLGEAAPAVASASPDANIKKANVPFLTVENGYLHSSPLGGGAFFDFAELENMIQQVFAWSPSAVVTNTGTESGGAYTNTVDITAVQALNTGLTHMFLPWIIVQYSAPQLNALPAGIISVRAQIPGLYTATSDYNTIQIGTAKVTNRINLVIVPYNLVLAHPRPVLGVVTANKSVTVTSSGLPTGTQISVILPGTTHPSIRSTIAFGR